MPHPLFSPEVRLMLQENDAAGMAAFVENLHPATVAESLDDLNPNDIWRFLKSSPIQQQALVFEYFPHEEQEELSLGTGREEMAKLIEQMSHDDRADLLQRLAPSVSEALLRLVDEADRRDIALLTKYPEGTAGAVMTTDYAWLPEGISVGEALERLRLQAPNTETLYYVYVLDSERRLLGIASLRDLILAQRQTLIRDVMETDLYVVNAEDDREEVAQKIARYDLLALPVVDADNRLIGIVTHDDVVDVLMQEATEDAEKMGGVVPIGENYMDANFFTIWRKRVVWLSLLFLAELFTFTALEHFEDAIKAVTVLSLFIPLCLSTGGNSGSQAATLITRSLALRHITTRDWLKVFRHELLMGLVLGLSLGGIGFVRASLTHQATLRNDEERAEPFAVQLEPGQDLDQTKDGYILIPQRVLQLVGKRYKTDSEIQLPSGGKLQRMVHADGTQSVQFPANCVFSTAQVKRFDLAWIVACAVAAICLLGTLVGSILPLVFRALGLDPALASSPFVATFVDVSGIMIFFNIAVTWLPGLGR
jgi:magnesium transporter